MSEPEGVLTFAFGPPRYREQAISLAQSIRLHNPQIRIACVTDEMGDSKLNSAFDILIPLNPERGVALQQKLWFDAYTPFERTAFIDSDCLVVGSLQDILNRCKGQAFAPMGYLATSGWSYMNIEQVLLKYKLPFMPRFNGGYYYFERTSKATLLFDRARQIGRIHKRLGFFELGLWFNEEVFYAFAMACLRMEPVPDDTHTGMYTPDDFTEPFFVNVIEGGCHFKKNGQDYRPVIVHFFGRHGLAFHYLREKSRLSMFLNGKPAFYRSTVLGLGELAFGIVVGIYRLVAALKGKPLPFKSNFPVVSVTNFGGSLARKIFER